MKNSYVTVTDQFCGAGGSSQGAEAAGAEVIMAMNHWKLAIETHQTNFPKTDHHCTDVSASDPRHYRRTDILITSPECVNHTIAKGRRRAYYQTDVFGKLLIDPSEERSRATMWDVPRFAEVHKYELIIVENVVDARSWILWDAWLHAMDCLGYDHKAVYFNSMFAPPTPQSRDRMYVVFWRKGNRDPDLDIRPPAPCLDCGREVAAMQSWKRAERQHGRYGSRGQYVYTCPECRRIVHPWYAPALTAIDWSLPIQRIGDRDRPLRPKTMERIELGLTRFGNQRLEFLVDRSYSGGNGNYIWPVTDAAATQTTRQSLALIDPLFLGVQREHGTPRGLDQSLQTVVTDNQHFLVALTRDDPPRRVLQPYPTQTGTELRGLIVELDRHGRARPASDAIGTIRAEGNHHGLLMPYLTRHYTSRGDTGGTSTGVDEALRTVTATDHPSLTVPEPLLFDYHGNANVRPVSSPHFTVDTRDREGIVMPFVVSQYNGPSRHPVHAVAEPLMTQPATGIHRLAVPGETPRIEDCGFRMLEPHEIRAAMAFPGDYVILGNKREKVRQLGNAVTPPVMRILLERCIETLAG